MAFTLVENNIYVDIPMSGKVYVYFRISDGEITSDIPLKYDELPTTEQHEAAVAEYINNLNAQG